MIKTKVVIVGGGPAGSACACTLRQRGIDEVILIDKSSFPRAKPCGGGLGPGIEKWLDAIGVKEKVLKEANTITAMKAITPAGKELKIGGITKAYVLPREKLDFILIEHLKSMGVEIITGDKVIKFLGNAETPEGVITASGKQIEAIWTVVATGANKKLINVLRKKSPVRKLKSVIARYENIDVEPESIEMYFDEDVKPMYGWVFPESKNTANIGICYEHHKINGTGPATAFNMFIHKYLSTRVSKSQMKGPVAGSPIFTTFNPCGIATPGLIVVGEAGALVNPATGEGIRQAIRSGIWAGEAIADHLSGKLSAGETATKYERRVKSGLQPGLITGEILRMVTHSLIELIAQIFEIKNSLSSLNLKT